MLKLILSNGLQSLTFLKYKSKILSQTTIRPHDIVGT